MTAESDFTATMASSLSASYLLVEEGEAHQILTSILATIKKTASTTSNRQVTVGQTVYKSHSAAIVNGLKQRGFKAVSRGESRDGYYIDITW